MNLITKMILLDSGVPDLQYKFKIKTADEEDPSFIDLSNEELWIGMTVPTEDGTYMLLKGDALFIKVAENNTQFLNDNFDVEVQTNQHCPTN